MTITKTCGFATVGDADGFALSLAAGDGASELGIVEGRFAAGAVHVATNTMTIDAWKRART